jgi:hypothetical protein
MWKIAVGFVVFAALALFILSRGGGDIDMSGEKHGTETAPAHAEVAAAPASSATPAPVAPASAASAAASSAKP